MKNVVKIILFIFVFSLIFTACENGKIKRSNNRNVRKVEAAAIESDCCKEAQKVAVLEEREKWLNKEIEDLQARLDECEGKKSVARKKTTTPVVKKKSAPAPKKNETVVIKKPAQSEKLSIVTEERESSPVVVDLTYLRQNGDGDIIFWTRANGDNELFFPTYAIDKGAKIKNVVKNASGDGYNFSVAPSKFYEKDGGVTNWGVFYVQDSLIRKPLELNGIALEYVEIFNKYTGWDTPARMELVENEFWIYKTSPK